MAQGDINVMHHHQGDDIASSGLPAHQIHHVELIVQIQRAERLIEQQQRRLADKRLGQADELLLPAGKPVEVAERQMFNAQLAQQGHHLLLASRVVHAAGRALGDDNRLQHVQMDARRQRLRQIDHLFRPPGKRQRQQVFPVKRQLPRRGAQAGHRPHQGRFAAAVGAQQGGDFTARQTRYRQVADNLALRIAGAEARQRQPRRDVRIHTFPRWRKMMLRKNGTPTSEVTIPTGIMAPGIRFFDATEASDSTSAPIRALAGR
nr:Uncharacterised protein [Raoultella sp. NCTC 9187]